MVKKNCRVGFSLIELLFVIAVISILAAIAIPVYKSHMISARLTEVTNGMRYIATGIAQYRQGEFANVWPNCGSVAEIQMSLGVGLSALGKINSASVNRVTGVISVTVTNIDSTVDGRIITLMPTTTSDASISWDWGGTLPPKYIPKR